MELFSLRLGGQNVMEAAAKAADEIARLRAELADARAQVAHVEGIVAELNDKLAEREREVERLTAALEAAIALINVLRKNNDNYHNTTEYERKFDDALAPLRSDEQNERDAICPDCRGERRGADGALCKRCGGTAQIRRSDLLPGEVAPFEQ